MTVDSAEPAMVPTTTVPVTEEGEARQVLRLLEALDDHDDVQNVWSNFDMPDEVMAAAGRLIRPRPPPAIPVRPTGHIHLGPGVPC